MKRTLVPLAALALEGRPYKKKTELVERRVVPESAYKQFSDKVIAKHSETKKK